MRAGIAVNPIARLIRKNGNTGTSRRPSRYQPPSRATPASIAAMRAPKRACTQSRSSQRATSKASVAPIEEANEAIKVPQPRPKIAPAASVRTAAPGRDSAVTAT